MPGGSWGGGSTWSLRRLIHELGGDTVVKAAYHRRFGVTGTPMTAWADARGAGFGPTLTVGSAALDATKNFFAFTTTCAAFCAANAAFVGTASCSIVYIGQCVGSATYDVVVIDDSSSQTRNFEIGTTNTAGQWGIWASAGGAPVNPGSAGVTDVASPNPIRLVHSSLVTSVQASAAVYNHALQTFVTTGFVAAGNNALNINTWNLQSTVGEGAILVRMVLFVKPSVTAARWAVLGRFAQADAGIAIAA